MIMIMFDSTRTRVLMFHSLHFCSSSVVVVVVVGVGVGVGVVPVRVLC